MKCLSVFAWLYPSYLQLNVAAAVVGSAVVGAAASSASASKAAKAQGAASDAANATQMYMYDQTRADNAPFRDAGVAANNRLAHLLGLQVPGSGYSYNGQELLNFNSQGVPTYNPNLYSSNAAYRKAYDDYSAMHQAQYGQGYTSGSDFNQISNYLRNQLPAEEAGAPDAEYGSLLRNFSQSDLEADPIYRNTVNFALEQGNQGINRQAAASGNLLSGATLKALSRFGANTAATYGNDAYNRYNTNQNNTYNRLAGLSGAGQQATNQVSASGQNYANQVGNNLTSLGNARGASAIAQGNAWGNAAGQLGNAYMRNQYMNNYGSSAGQGTYSEEMARLMGGS